MEFIFKIGDSVGAKQNLEDIKWLRSHLNETDKNFWKNTGRIPVPFRLFIIERRQNECPGGIQKHYLCRYVLPDGFKVEWFNETELTNYPEEES